jgi:hypothetical protein
VKTAQVSQADHLTYALHILKTLGLRNTSRENIQNILSLAGPEYKFVSSMPDEQWTQVYSNVFKDYSSPDELSKARRELSEQPQLSEYHREPGLQGGTDRPYYLDPEDPKVLKNRLEEYEELYERMEKTLRDRGINLDDNHKARLAQLLENRVETVKEFLSLISELGIDVLNIRQVSELASQFTHPGAMNLFTIDDDELAQIAAQAKRPAFDESKYQNRPTKSAPVPMSEATPEPQAPEVPIPPRKPAPAPGTSAPPATPPPLQTPQAIPERKPAPILRPPPPPMASSVQRDQQFGGEARSQPTPDEGLQYGDPITADGKNVLISRPGRRSQDVARVGQGVFSLDKALRQPLFRGNGVGYIVGAVDAQTVKVWIDGAVYPLPLSKLELDMKGRSLKPKGAQVKDVEKLVITLRGDDPNGLKDMLEYIQHNAGIGHSFEVVVDPGDSERERSFGFDGDGAFRIDDIEVAGQDKEAQNMFAPNRDAKYFMVYTFNQKALDRLVTLMRANPNDYDFEEPEPYIPEDLDNNPGGFVGMAQAVQPQAPQVGAQPGQPPTPNAIPTTPDGQPAKPGDYVQPQGPSTDPNTQGTVQQVNPDGSMLYQDGAGQQKVKQPNDPMQVVPQG